MAESAVKCPNCGLLNPASAQWCDCGYNFQTGEVAQQDMENGETYTGSGTPAVQSSFFMGNSFLSFRMMITPAIIRLLYFMGTIAITATGAVLFIQGVTKPDSSVIGGLNNSLVGVLLITVGNLLWRMVCESIILFFSMHDVLVSIEKKLGGR